MKTIWEDVQARTSVFESSVESANDSHALIQLREAKKDLDQALERLMNEHEEIYKEIFEMYGKNIHGIKEVEKHFGKLTAAEKLKLFHIPFSRETLEACKDTHVLVVDVGVSLLEIKSKNIDLFRDKDLDDTHEFALRTDAICWRLIRKTPVENSFDKTWNEQLEGIDSDFEEVPSVRQVVYAIILHFLTTNDRLFKRTNVRTSDVVLNLNHVDVGFFDGGGLSVNGGFDRGRYDNVGVSSSRKS